MTDPVSRLVHDADALRSAAQRFHDDAADPACAAVVPTALAAIEDAVYTLSRTCCAAAHAFVPLRNSGTSIAERYARAATTWPSPRDGVGPSHEQQARVLSSLHDAAAALRNAGGHCGRAAVILDATLAPVDQPAHAALTAPSGIAAEP
jgi:hypothetical protein